MEHRMTYDGYWSLAQSPYIQSSCLPVDCTYELKLAPKAWMPHEYVFERRISLGRPKYLQGGGLGGEGNEREEREAGKGTSVGGLMFYHGFFFFVSYPQSSLNGTQLYWATWLEVSVIWKCISEMWGIPPPINQRPQNHLFSTVSQLKSKFNGV